MLLLSLALALTPQQADDRIRSMRDLEVEPDLYRRVEEPVVIAHETMSVTLTSGVMVPVFSGRFAGAWENRSRELLRSMRTDNANATLPSAEDRGDRELVGFVWLDADAELALELPRRSDAIELASRQVMYLGADRDAMREVARQRQPFTTQVSEGLVLTSDPQLDAWFLGGDEGTPYEVVVYESDPPLGRAEELLEDRLALWDAKQLDWGEVVAADRMERTLGLDVADSWLIDAHTADRYARVSEMPTSQDRWLALVDRHGRYQQGWDHEVLAAGVTPEGAARAIRVGGVRAPSADPDDPTAAAAPPTRFEPVHADVRVLAHPPRNALDMEVEITERIQLRALTDASYTWLLVPRVEAVDDSFEWVGASLPDGTPLSRPEQVGRKESKVATAPKPKPKPKGWREKEIEAQEQRELNRNRHAIRVVFPEPVKAGEEVAIDLQWKDTWPIAHRTVITPRNQPSIEKSMGNTSGLQRFLPYIDGHYASWDYQLSVGIPLESSFSAAVSGPVAVEEEVDGWRFVRTSEVQNARYPNVVVGKYTHKRFGARKGLPAVEVRLLSGDKKQLQGLAIEARAAMAYMARYLPSYGLGEYDIVEAPSAVDHFTWVAPHGMQMMQKMLKTEVGRGRMSEDVGRGTFAHEVAHQWWGQMAQPASLDDRWMIETFAEVFSCMYVAKANERVEPCVDELEEHRKGAEGTQWWADIRGSASLEEAFTGGNRGKVVYKLGPYIMLNMLRPRIGTEAFFGGLSRMLADHPGEEVTNERLQTYLERTSGQNLDDFFDFWVRQGILPKVELTWSSVPTNLSLEITSDVPFGTFDIPVVVQDDYRKRVIPVTVRDGVGRADVDGDYRRTAKVILDPAHRTLTRSRSVSKR